MKRTVKIIVALAFLLIMLPAALWSQGSDRELGPGLFAEMKTNRGTMYFRLDYDRTPLTVLNFCGLAEGTLPNDDFEEGHPYFDGLSFYREAPNYAIFSGDPDGTGTGGPGYSIPREVGALISTGAPGVLVMDGLVSESAGSRFFITINGDAFLDSKYTAFGRIIYGENVLKRLRKGDKIESVKIIRNGGDVNRLVFDEENFEVLEAEARQKDLEALRVENTVLADIVIALGDGRLKTPSGIFYNVVKAGTENPPGKGDRVSMHYTGKLLDGTVFDSSRTRGATFDFTLGVDGVIPGWIEMIMSMSPGEARTVVIPPSMGYGEQGYGPIPPNSWLIFDMELVSYIEG